MLCVVFFVWLCITLILPNATFVVYLVHLLPICIRLKVVLSMLSRTDVAQVAFLFDLGFIPELSCLRGGKMNALLYVLILSIP